LCSARFWLLLALLLEGGAAVRAQVTVTDSAGISPERWDVRLLGQPLDTLLNKRFPAVDTAYIAGYYSFLHVQLLEDNRNQLLRLRTPDAIYRYRPNGPSTLGLGLGYGWLGIDLMVRPGFLNGDDARKGRTRQFRTNLNVNTRKIWLGAQYQNYRGLYLANPEILGPTGNTDGRTFSQRPDLRTRTFVVQGYYCFNHRQFSNPATYWQRERQKRSAGSWLLGSTLALNGIRADSSLLPPDAVPGSGLLRYRSLSLGVNVGYVQTFVFKKHWFFTASLRPGLALKSASRLSANDETARVPVRLGGQGDGRFVLGFNHDRFYGGVAYSLAVFSGNLEELANVRLTYGHIRLLVGTRLAVYGRRKSEPEKPSR
jgi:hypothetical protein